MKDGVLKALLKIEYEIDLLENELKSIESESGVARASSMFSSFTFKNYGSCSTGQDDVASIIPQAATLQVESPGDTGLEEVCHVKGTHSDCYVTAASDMFVKDNRMENEDVAQSAVPEMVKVGSGSRREEIVRPFEHFKLAVDAESKLCDLILSSNKEYAQKSSAEIFNKLLLGDHDKLNAVKVGRPFCCQDDPRTREKFTQRKQFLMFKERALALKFKAFHHLWQKDMCVLSLRKSRSKTWKKLESSLRIKLGGCQKPRSSICPRMFSPGIKSLMLNKEVIHYTSKLLIDTPGRIYREALKMPALILDEREKIVSRFISFNGLVEDPCAVEKERTMINPWTVDEREIFLEKLGKYGKDFRRIASFLDHKTTADCVEFYYKNHKSEDFQGWKKNLDRGMQPKLNSVNTYMVTSGQMRNRAVNSVSLDLLSEASLVASRDLAETRSDELERRICPRKSFLRPCSSSRSSRVNSLDDEREAVAGDILTDIHSSVANTKSGENDLSDWTDAERSTFMQGVSRYGKDFAMISQYMKTRSKDQCRAFFSKARKCLGLDSMLPAAAAKPLNSDASAGGDDMDGPSVVKNGPVIRKDNSVADKNHELLISVKVETTDAIDCGSSTDQKEAAYGSCPKGSQVCEEKASRISLESHDFLPEID
nr:R2R3 MYB transcription factor [Lagerstroemia indica]